MTFISFLWLYLAQDQFRFATRPSCRVKPQMLCRTAATVKCSKLRLYRCLYSTSSSRPKAKRVKKQIAELPQTYTLPSGEPATPLPPLQGASDAPSTPKGKVYLPNAIKYEFKGTLAKKRSRSTPSKPKRGEKSLPKDNATRGNGGE
jgi:hypothetical protein